MLVQAVAMHKIIVVKNPLINMFTYTACMPIIYQNFNTCIVVQITINKCRKMKTMHAWDASQLNSTGSDGS